MKTDLLVKFLRHLISCTEAVLLKEDIESYDILSLRRELAQLKRNIDGTENIDPVILARIIDLKLEIDDNLLADSKRSIGMFLIGTLFHGSTVATFDRIHRKESLKHQVSRFRDDIDHLRFSLDP